MKQDKVWPSAIIFDLDGTLVDSAPDIRTALNLCFQEASLKTHSLEEVRLMIGGGAAKLIERALRSQGEQKTATEFEHILSRFLYHYAANPVAETTLYPNAAQVITKLDREGYKLGLCTNKPQDITLMVLDAFELRDYFDVIVGHQKDLPRKPDPASLNKTLSELDLASDEVLMIGDSGADVGAARALDISIFIMSYGYSKIPPHELGADGVLEDLLEVDKILNPLGDLT